jgi:signal transduction histidine kinase/CheY-like chemotaxis protein
VNEMMETDRLLHLQRIALALARDADLVEMAAIVARECHQVLVADAVCIFLRSESGEYQLITHIGCSEEFVQTWRTIPQAFYRAIAEHVARSDFFYGSAGEFKQELPEFGDQVDRSGRSWIGYAPLSVNDRIVGLIGFSYNRAVREKLDRSYVSLLINLCSQALERTRLADIERAANKARSEFLAAVNHEIRTPLGLIQGYTELLTKAEDLSRENRRWAEIVFRTTKHLASIVGDVLDISKIEARRLEVVPTVFRLSEVIEDVRLAASQQAQDRGLEFKVTSIDLPEFIVSDPVRLRQILLNLIGNSLKFTEHGFVRLQIKMISPVTMEALVVDSGAGIDVKDKERIFEPFTQAVSHLHQQARGTGLGLPISRAWAQALGGDLTLVRSQLGNGSEFRLTINCRVPRWSEVLNQKGQSHTISAPNLEGLRLLIVDDSEDNRDLFNLLLSRSGALISLASTGHEAIVKAKEGPFDLILMDLEMPQMTGTEAVMVLRRGGYKGPIVALTGHATREHQEQAMRCGFDDFLTKPVVLPSLFKVVHRLTHQGT